VQEKQFTRSIEGDWLVLADRSPSMHIAIEASRVIAGTLARAVQGKVYLVFFDGVVSKALDVSGKTYDEIKRLTAHVTAGGSATAIGAGMLYAMERGWNVDGVTVVTDGGENVAPVFAQAYQSYCKRFEKEPPVYCYLLKGSSHDVMTQNCERAGVTLNTFDLRGGAIDYYSLPNIVATMSTKRYGLVDRIMETPLLTVQQALAA
jgi:hypothetical protein